MRWAGLALLLLLVVDAFIGDSAAGYVFEGVVGSREATSFGVGFGSEAFAPCTLQGTGSKARNTAASAGLVRRHGFETGLFAES